MSQQGGINKQKQRRHHTLTIQQKVEVLDMIHKKIKYSEISQKYQIGISTVSDIKKKQARIREFSNQFAKQGVKTTRKTMRMGNASDMEIELFAWCRYASICASVKLKNTEKFLQEGV
eukprot:TRINITY_DN6446_c0_g1_i6.p1 TRINITY_DN6446_c0_g1~~TRINITY_DN6446_c0_g1_i6.p1  ORF type:complete len:118 (+),score=6.66 TRINITY_DN6446_c0_g1_i6:112-465(+)